MTAQSHSTRKKLSLLELAEELQNVSKACRIMGYHRDSFYEIRRAFQVGGVQALVEAKRGPRARVNRKFLSATISTCQINAVALPTFLKRFAAAVRSRTAANGDSITFVVRRCFQCPSGKS